MRKILDSLNNIQKKAVTTTEIPLLVLAGAGTGKTKVLTVRASYIIKQNLALPAQVLAVTFTNKAASEMKERIASLLGSEASSMWVGTFHSIGLRILRVHYEKVFLQNNFIILDNEDSQKILKDILLEDNVDVKAISVKYISGCIASLKDKAIYYDEIPRDRNLKILEDLSLSDIYKKYNDKLKELNAVDFNDLLLLCVKLFESHPDILEIYQNKFKYILVDEYQDTNVLQHKFLKMLSLKHSKICCVGDDDQSIYSWRGADISNILRFQEDFSSAEVVRLEENYRSTTPILETASILIANNSKRWGKSLWTSKEGGEKIIVKECMDSASEANFIVEEISNYFREGYNYNEMAILVRAGYQTREIEEVLLKNHVPYKIVGSNKFYERLEIKDALAYLRLCFQPNDNISFERVVNTPKRGVGAKALDAIKNIANDYKISYYAALEALLQNQYFTGKNKLELSNFYSLIKEYNNLINKISLPELAEKVLETSGYINMWKNERSEDSKIRLDNIIELLNSLSEFGSLSEYLEHVSLMVSINDSNEDNKLSIMTLHAAKGLEFDVVFLSGWEEGTFPSFRSISENEGKGLEEERRLAYVGITRAKQHLIISYSKRRVIFGNWQDCIPSRFINELGKKHIQFSKQQSFNSEWNIRDSKKSFFGELNNKSPIKGGIFNKIQNKNLNYIIGSTVKHQTFGIGIVVKQEGPMLRIKFNDYGEKQIMVNFINKL